MHRLEGCRNNDLRVLFFVTRSQVAKKTASLHLAQQGSQIVPDMSANVAQVTEFADSPHSERIKCELYRATLALLSTATKTMFWQDVNVIIVVITIETYDTQCTSRRKWGDHRLANRKMYSFRGRHEDANSYPR